MAKSRRFIQLESRIKFLEQNILPTAKPLGNYTKKEQDLIRSFVFLVHAEIEAYLEDRAKDKVQKSLANWTTSRVKSNCLLSVASFVGNELGYENDTNANRLIYRINKTVAHYLNSVVDRNHGIKESNILNLLLPLGIEHSSLNQTWLNVMESFGADRGAIAHKSFKVQNPIDRTTELNRIKTQILPELQVVDQKISSLK